MRIGGQVRRCDYPFQLQSQPKKWASQLRRRKRPKPFARNVQQLHGTGRFDTAIMCCERRAGFLSLSKKLHRKNLRRGRCSWDLRETKCRILQKVLLVVPGIVGMAQKKTSTCAVLDAFE